MNYNLVNELKKIIYGVGISKQFYKIYGTKENTTIGYPKQILNVMDAHNSIKKLVIDDKLKNDNDYKNMESLGTLNIYQNGTPMEFVPL